MIMDCVWTEKRKKAAVTHLKAAYLDSQKVLRKSTKDLRIAGALSKIRTG
jgi:hypothetical protein